MYKQRNTCHVFCVCRTPRSCAGTWENQGMLCFLWEGMFPPTSESTLTWTRTLLLLFGPIAFSVVSQSKNFYTSDATRFFLNCPLDREDFCWAETRKECCPSGTRKRFPPTVARNCFNLYSGSGRTGTAPMASGNMLRHHPALKAVFYFLRCQNISTGNFQVALPL